MKIIRELSKQMRGELKNAQKWANLAVMHKPTNPTLARAYFEMANDEVKHSDLLHKEAVSLISAEREKNQPPQWMLDMWAEDHKEFMEEDAKAKYMISMFAK